MNAWDVLGPVWNWAFVILLVLVVILLVLVVLAAVIWVLRGIVSVFRREPEDPPGRRIFRG